MGLLFHATGPKTTLFCYSIASAIILVAFLAYIYILPKILKITKNFRWKAMEKTTKINGWLWNGMIVIDVAISKLVY